MTADARALPSCAPQEAQPLSLWHDQLPEEPVRPPLPGSTQADVVIVGAGYTGLWTAYYLAKADPSLRVVVLESQVAGFGASGRNGGWCSALFPASWHRLARVAGRPAAVAMQHALQDAVAEVGRVADREGIDCHFALGGAVELARGPAQLRRAKAEVREARSFGLGADTLDLLSAPAAREQLQARGVLGALRTDHCATLHPGLLVRGLARAVERLGVVVHEGTTVHRTSPGAVHTDRGTVTADVVLLATEGFTASLPGHRRDLAPVYSLMLATEPLPPEVWDRIGLRDRQAFNDLRHLTIYGQRTADDRIAFGGRGAPYHFASRTDPSYERVEAVHTGLWNSLVDLLPQVAGAQVTHRWGGNLGVPRDWFPSVGLDRQSGTAWAGGYVGDGVATSQLAGRTLADLVTGADTDRTHLPWVRRRRARWEPEPLRWIGVNAVTALMTRADRAEARSGQPSRTAAGFWKALGQ